MVESKAVVIHEPVDTHNFADEQPARIETIEVSEPTGEEVLVEIGAASLCHTDVSIALGNLKEQYPLVMGHEGAGTVRAVGELVDSVKPGDKVVLGRVACGRCQYCRDGHGQLCERRAESMPEGTLRTGAVRFERDGEPRYHCHSVSSFTEHTLTTEDVAIKVTDDLPMEQASLLGCGVFTGVGAVTNTADIEPGASVAIFGVGGVGLSAVQGAAMRSAGQIIAVDIVKDKLELATSLGATHTINSSERDVVSEIRDITDGGVDYAFDITGVLSVTEQTYDVTAPKGEAIVVGVPPFGKQDMELDVYEMVLSEKELKGSFNGSYTLPRAIPKLADLIVGGKISVDPLITDSRPLEEVNEAMQALEDGGQIRQMILP